ncbi:uncharacterized protein At2g33490-like [Ipomoea triloba]|uniref:uncharacterized protein At2g33490-like n=1 Tax=Ipomoea triloba TaxID=35885 RepID=UPI00125D437C|nr:uncharacterized protein At2g33490-like [Ipomoea triloba]
MKTSLRKLRGFAALRHDRRERKLRSFTQEDELAQANQDMQDTRDCYEKLLSAAAATANSAYEFSESLGEMGDCLLEKTALVDDQESGKVLLMLGKVQFQLQKLLDNYRSHISQTITAPSESLLHELNIVEDMKKQCDGKREAYDHLIQKYREKGKLRGTKGECFSSHKLQAAYDEYDNGANVFVLRMKSLRQGQSLSLLTQASRHHAAQLSFFRKAVKYLEEIEPHVKLVTELQHIDYPFSGLGDDSWDDTVDDDNDGYDTYESKDESGSDDDGELSFDHGQSDQEYVSTKSMELDGSDVTFPQVAKADSAKENLRRSIGGVSFAFRRENQASSKSAPLLAELKFDNTDRAMQMGSSPSYKIHSYVLPTPVEKESRVSFKPDTEAPQIRRTSLSKSTENLWHSSPLDINKYEKLGATDKVSEHTIFNSQSVLKESNNNSKSSRLVSEGHSLPRLDPFSASDAKKLKRQAYSGPLTEKTWPNNPSFSTSGPMLSTGYPQRFSGSLLRPQPSSTPKFASLSSSPPFMSSSPKISELHELPRPPSNLSSSPTPPSNLVAHSGPLASKGPGLSPTNRTASTLPVPPTAFPRSYSIPTRGETETALRASKPVIDVPSSPSVSQPLSNIQQPTPPAS